MNNTPQPSRKHRPPLDIEQAAAYLGVEVRMMRRLVQERRIAFIRIGRHLRFDPNDLDEMLRANRVEALRPRGGAAR